MTNLSNINADDQYLDILAGDTSIEDLPEVWQTELSRVLLGWIKEVREAPWQPTPAELPGF